MFRIVANFNKNWSFLQGNNVLSMPVLHKIGSISMRDQFLMKSIYIIFKIVQLENIFTYY